MKAKLFSFPDQSQDQKCVAGITPRKELSRRTQEIRNSDKKVKISQGISKRPGSESEKDSESRYCI
jgi:hypothetical protein